jgi:hypothetical protein
MRQTIEIIVLACIAVALYFNLTSIPKQDYTCCNNPWARTVTRGPLVKIGVEE